MNEEKGNTGGNNPENNAETDDSPIVPAPEHQELKTPASNQETDQPDNQQEESIWSRTRNWFHRKSVEANLTDWLMAVFTFILAATTIVFTIYARRQWREMHDAGTQTDKIITADERIAKAMENSVRQAQNSFDAANKQARLTQRAWIQASAETFSPKGPVFTWTEGQPFILRITVKNTGRTPAINVRDAFIVDITPRTSGTFSFKPAPNFTYQPTDYVFAGNINPDNSIWMDLNDERFNLTAIDRNNIISGKLRIYAHGEVTYDDVFGIHHWLTYCQTLLNGGAYAACPYHNETDHNE